MAGVVFVVCVPTANYEQILTFGSPDDSQDSGIKDFQKVFSVEVELRDKHNTDRIPITMHDRYRGPVSMVHANNYIAGLSNLDLAPMEKILDELLKKLEVEHVVWIGDKDANYYEVIFPVPAGDPCENLLHCLTQLGIGKKLNSVVSVIPCSVVYSGLETEAEREEYLLRNSEEKKKWKSFVESIRSKLTVKQVVDGVRSGGQLSFDYLLLIVTADCLAALGLVENNSPNIVAAMLVSPLMGPVMSITFGTIIADRELQWVGLGSLIVGMLISCLFGFIFGLILGTTEMPWGFGDWPTEEMKSRGNVRSLWMGVLWALTSGSGVAVALLQGSAGPLIGVAISASLLPPVVNCGLFWALACIWLRYEGVKIPHIKGEEYQGNSSYVPLYSDYIPIEFAINGIVSACLTVVNVICIFITAIIVLKIKEVAAPYTSSPELRRFWQHDLRAAREENRNSSMRKAEEDERKEYMMNEFSSMEMGDKLDEAIREAVDDETFRKVQRVSYQTHGPEDVARQLLNSSPHRTMSRSASFNISSNRASPSLSDLAALDKIVNSLLGMQSKDTYSHHKYKHSFKSKRGSTASNSSSSALPTILEGGSANRESGSSHRKNSWANKVKNNIQNRISQGYDNLEPQESLLRDSADNNIHDIEEGK